MHIIPKYSGFASWYLFSDVKSNEKVVSFQKEREKDTENCFFGVGRGGNATHGRAAIHLLP